MEYISFDAILIIDWWKSVGSFRDCFLETKCKRVSAQVFILCKAYVFLLRHRLVDIWFYFIAFVYWVLHFWHGSVYLLVNFLNHRLDVLWIWKHTYSTIARVLKDVILIKLYAPEQAIVDERSSLVVIFYIL